MKKIKEQKYKKYPILGIFAGILAIFLFRLDIVYGKMSLTLVSPLFLTFISTIITAIIITLFLESKHSFKEIFTIPKRNIFFLIVSSIISGIFAPLLFLYGLKYTSGINASIFINLNYLFLSILAIGYLKEKKSFSLFLGITISLVGIFYLGTNGMQASFSLQTGDVFVILAGFSFALSTMIYKKYILHIKTSLLIALRTITCGVFLTIAILVIEPQTITILFTDLSALYYVGAYSIFVIFLSYIFFFWSLENVKATTFAILGLLSPIVGAFYATTILNEQLLFQDIIGIAIILGGIVLTKYHVLKHSLETVKLKYRVKNSSH